MDKQNLYVALLNATLGVVMSLLVKGSMLIYGLAFIITLTILFIERHRIYDKIFRRKPWLAATGGAVLVIAMAGMLALVTRSNRDRSLIIKTTHDFIDHLKPGEYPEAYEMLSDISKKAYPLDLFVKDNQRSSIQVQDFRIDGVEFNEFDKKKAVVKVSSPFLIYGQSSMSFELVKEDPGWRLVITPSLVQQKELQANQTSNSNGAPRSTSKRRSSGSMGGFLRSIF
jgi:hypothetical protein